MKDWMCASLFICALLTGCGPPPDWSDKDVDFLMSKLESGDVIERGRAIRRLTDKTGARDRVVAALTHKLLNDTHEQVRSNAAQALGSMNAVESVPVLVKALHLPATDRGKPLDLLHSTGVSLPDAVGAALESIGTPEALKALEEWKKLAPNLIESSVPDGATGVDADFINENGITLRFRGNTESGSCQMLNADGNIIWRESFEQNAVTFKPDPDDRKLVNGTSYQIDIYVSDDSSRFLKTGITFTTKE